MKASMLHVHVASYSICEQDAALCTGLDKCSDAGIAAQSQLVCMWLHKQKPYVTSQHEDFNNSNVPQQNISNQIGSTATNMWKTPLHKSV